LFVAAWSDGRLPRPTRLLNRSSIEAGALVVVLAVGAYLRLAMLDFAQFRADDVALWNIARDFLRHPQILTRGMHSSFGLSNGPFQAYLLLPGVLATPSPIGAYCMVALLNVAGIALFWAFVRSYWGSSLALLACSLYAVNPWAVVFSRRLWGNDLVAPFTILLIWSLCDLVRCGRRRDSVLPLLWLAIVVQVYVVALIHLLLAALGLVLGARRLRLLYFMGGIIVFAGLTVPYFLYTALPSVGSLARLLGSSEALVQVDLTSTRFMFHMVSSEGYQAVANNTGRLLNATIGLPRAVSWLTEAFLALGILVASVEVARLIRRRALEQTAPYVLPLVAMILPVMLLVRHTTPVYPQYLLTGFPMHFLFIGLGFRQLWRALRRVLKGWSRRIDLLPTCTVGVVGSLIVATHLLMAQVFFVAIREYWPKSDYGLPLRYTLDVVKTIRELIGQQGFTRVYIGGPEERDSVLYRALRPDLPILSLFDSSDTFVRPDADAGKALYILSSVNDRVGQVFNEHLSAARVVSLDVPGSGLRYSFFGVAATELGELFIETSGTPLAVSFDGRVRLDSYLMEPELHPGHSQQLILHWTLLEGMPRPVPCYYSYLRLIDSAHKVYEGANSWFYDPAQWHMGEQLIWWRTLPIPENLDPGVYSYLVGLYTVTSSTSYRNATGVDASGAMVGDGTRLGPLTVRFAGPASPTHQLSTEFDQKVVLRGYDLEGSGCAADGSLSVNLYWQCIGRMDRNYTVFLHLLGPDGKMVSQDDSQPVSGRFPTTGWLLGDTIIDSHTLQLPSTLAPSQYSLEAGLYYLVTGERLGGPGFAAVFPVAIEECRR